VVAGEKGCVDQKEERKREEKWGVSIQPGEVFNGGGNHIKKEMEE